MSSEPSLSLTHDEAQRRLERLADRLRVVGPRLAAREGEPARAMLARIRAGLQRIADLAAEADGEPRRPVPELGAHALGDQAMVLGLDLLGPEGYGPRADERRIAAGRAVAEINDLI